MLTNPRHEAIAQALAQGKSADEASILAGYKADRGNASRRAARPDVQQRVQQITADAAAKVGITVERVLEELARIGFANMLDYMRVDGDGKPYTDFSGLTREQAAAIQELYVETVPPAMSEEGLEIRPQVTKVRFKLADKRSALVDLGKHLGMFKERVELRARVTIASTEAIRSEVAEIFGAAVVPAERSAGGDRVVHAQPDKGRRTKPRASRRGKTVARQK